MTTLFWTQETGDLVLVTEHSPEKPEGPAATGSSDTRVLASLFARSASGGGEVMLSIAVAWPEPPPAASEKLSKSIWLAGRLPTALKVQRDVIVDFRQYGRQVARFILRRSRPPRDAQSAAVVLYVPERSATCLKVTSSPDAEAAQEGCTLLGMTRMARLADESIAAWPFEIAKRRSGTREIRLSAGRRSGRRHYVTLTDEKRTPDSDLALGDCVAVVVLARDEMRRAPDTGSQEPVIKMDATEIRICRVSEMPAALPPTEFSTPEAAQQYEIELSLDLLPRDLVAFIGLDKTALFTSVSPMTDTASAATADAKAELGAKPASARPRTVLFEATLQGLAPLSRDAEVGAPTPIDTDVHSRTLRWLNSETANRLAYGSFNQAPRRALTTADLFGVWLAPSMQAVLHGIDPPLALSAPLLAAIEALWSDDFTGPVVQAGGGIELLPLLHPRNDSSGMIADLEDASLSGETIFERLVGFFWEALPDEAHKVSAPEQSLIVAGLSRSAIARWIAREFKPPLASLAEALQADWSANDPNSEWLHSAYSDLDTLEIFFKADVNRPSRNLTLTDAMLHVLDVSDVKRAYPRLAALLGAGEGAVPPGSPLPEIKAFRTIVNRLSGEIGSALGGLSRREIDKTLAAQEDDVERAVEALDPFTRRPGLLTDESKAETRLHTSALRLIAAIQLARAAKAS